MSWHIWNIKTKHAHTDQLNTVVTKQINRSEHKVLEPMTPAFHNVASKLCGNRS